MKKIILIVTTVPDTLAGILRGQPKFLSKYYDVRLATSGGEHFASLAVEAVPSYRVNMKRGISPFDDLVSIIKMIVLLRKVKPDVLHSYTPKAGLVAMVAGYLCGVESRIHTFTGLIWPSRFGWRRSLLKVVDRLICRLATCIVPEGEGVRDDLIQYHITDKSLEIIGFGNIAGVDVEQFSENREDVRIGRTLLRRNLGIAADNFVYLYIGRLHREKGIHELAEAFVLVQEEFGDKCRLLLVGGHDLQAPIDQSTIRAIMCIRGIHMLGALKDVRPALSLSNILVLPSFREGFPNVVLEAGSMSVTAICTDVNGSREIIKDGLNGWIVPPKDVGSLAEAMIEAARCPPEVLRQMGAAARVIIENRYDRRRYLDKLLEFYEKQICDSVT